MSGDDPFRDFPEIDSEFVETALNISEERWKVLYQRVYDLCTAETPVGKSLILVSQMDDLTVLERGYVTWKLAERFFAHEQANAMTSGVLGTFSRLMRIHRDDKKIDPELESGE